MHFWIKRWYFAFEMGPRAADSVSELRTNTSVLMGLLSSGGSFSELYFVGSQSEIKDHRITSAYIFFAELKRDLTPYEQVMVHKL